jgi:hypothetical protein
MIKFLATQPGGRKVLGLGLSHGNIERLKGGQPIHFHVEQMHLHELAVHEVLIFAGETEETMRAQLETTGALDGCTVRTDPVDQEPV